MTLPPVTAVPRVARRDVVDEGAPAAEEGEVRRGFGGRFNRSAGSQEMLKFEEWRCCAPTRFTNALQFAVFISGQGIHPPEHFDQLLGEGPDPILPLDQVPTILATIHSKLKPGASCAWSLRPW